MYLNVFVLLIDSLSSFYITNNKYFQNASLYTYRGIVSFKTTHLSLVTQVALGWPALQKSDWDAVGKRT